MQEATYIQEAPAAWRSGIASGTEYRWLESPQRVHKSYYGKHSNTVVLNRLKMHCVFNGEIMALAQKLF
jgi:hypothetical protein